jgi:hypothetical protein
MAAQSMRKQSVSLEERRLRNFHCHQLGGAKRRKRDDEIGDTDEDIG